MAIFQAPTLHRPEPQSSPRGTILQVENNVANATVVQELIARRPDLVLRTVTNGHQGVDIAHTLQPDVILLDMRMPDLNGLQALARLQESHATEHIPVIILSSNAFLDEHRRCVEAGAFLYMTKPYRLVALMAAVDAALTHSATVYKAKLTA